MAFAYLALPAREKECVRDDIVSAIYEEHDIREENEANDEDYRQKGRAAFAYDGKVLGKLLQNACRDVGLPYVDPVAADRGSGAFHRLAEAYRVVDISTLERLAERIAVMNMRK